MGGNYPTDDIPPGAVSYGDAIVKLKEQVKELQTVLSKLIDAYNSHDHKLAPDDDGWSQDTCGIEKYFEEGIRNKG